MDNKNMDHIFCANPEAAVYINFYRNIIKSLTVVPDLQVIPLSYCIL
jgi:hypothetical protein